MRPKSSLLLPSPEFPMFSCYNTVAVSPPHLPTSPPQLNRLSGSAIHSNFLIIFLCWFSRHQAFGTCLCEAITSCSLFSLPYLRKAAVSRVIKLKPCFSPGPFCSWRHLSLSFLSISLCPLFSYLRSPFCLSLASLLFSTDLAEFKAMQLSALIKHLQQCTSNDRIMKWFLTPF